VVTENIHHRDGTAHGDFAKYVSELQQVGLETREEVFARSFKELVYSSETDSRFFPLSNCSVAKAEIQGQYFDMLWKGVSFSRCDLSHVRGVGHWSALEFDNCKLVRLIGSYSVADCVFRKSDLSRCHLYQPAFIRCRFEKCSFKGAVLIEPTFVECEVAAMDLARSRWQDCRSLEIRGNWKNGETLSERSDPRAKALFGRHPSSVPL